MEPPVSLEEMSQTLRAWLRAELGAPRLDYAAPPARLSGGYETYTYRFAVSGAPPPWDTPKVLRLYPARFGTSNALWESTVQNALADAGYPVPRAHVVCTDTTLLGGAFFVMERLPGTLMMHAPPEQIPGLLGRAHARLHDLDPGPLAQALAARGYARQRFSAQSRLDELDRRAAGAPWLREVVGWLDAQRPPEPERLSICHGDFHPLNILVHEGRISGVLDWPGLLIADPLLDMANTILLTVISGKHVLHVDQGERIVRLYLEAYRALRPLDLAFLDYYSARRAVLALTEGADGHPVWRQPPIERDLIAYVEERTGIRVTPPAIA